MDHKERWLKWAVELQSLAQVGLYYGHDQYDRERYARIREIAAEMVSFQSEIPLEKVKDLFCCETGYQTPKLDTRAAIFQADKILLVEENNGTWALPGGWVDVDKSIGENAMKEVREEAGLDAVADLVIAVQDGEKRNPGGCPFKVCKVFVLCTALGGAFEKNIETISSGYFALDELPCLAEEKNTAEQIALCFEAHRAEHWVTQFD